MSKLAPKDSAGVWANLRAIHPIFSSVARECAIEVPPCVELEQELGVPSAEAMAAAKQWVGHMDQKIGVHQLRHYLQTSTHLSNEVLNTLLSYYVSKEQRNDQDRDKVDFLMVQLFSDLAPANIAGPGLSLGEASGVLESVIGSSDLVLPEWSAELEKLLEATFRAKSLKELFTLRIIEQGRQIKIARGEEFFESGALAAFARFGFLVRRAFFRLMHQDLNEILDGLRELESAGVTTIDCRKAQFAADEPIARLRMICQSWKVMFQAEYSSGQPLCILVDLRTAVETALANHARLGGTRGKAKAAAASSQQDFEIAAPEPGDPDATES
jgi:hypothetical protein